MAGNAGLGTILRIDFSPSPKVAIAELTNIGGPSIAVDTLDVSSHSSWQREDNVDEVVFQNASNDILCAGHGLIDGNVIAFRTTNALPAEFSTNRWYYVVNAGTDTFQVSDEYGGTAITFTGDGTGTHHFYYAYAYREFVGGLIDGGEISLEGNLAEVSDADEIKDAVDDRDVLSFEVEFPNGDEWTFDGIMTNFETNAPHDDKLSFSASIKVTGGTTLS